MTVGSVLSMANRPIRIGEQVANRLTNTLTKNRVVIVQNKTSDQYLPTCKVST